MSQLTPVALQIDGSDFAFGIVAARFNELYVDGLLQGVLQALRTAGVSDASLTIERVPGSNELPVAARYLAESGRCEVVLALGVVIAGGTRHYQMVADSANYGLQRVAITTGVPVISGLVVGEDEAQVRERCLGSLPKGAEFGHSALEMAQLRRKYR